MDTVFVVNLAVFRQTGVDADDLQAGVGLRHLIDHRLHAFASAALGLPEDQQNLLLAGGGHLQDLS